MPLVITDMQFDEGLDVFEAALAVACLAPLRLSRPRPGLKRSALNLFEVVAQSVANIAPWATPALIVSLRHRTQRHLACLCACDPRRPRLDGTLNSLAASSVAPGVRYAFTAHTRWSSSRLIASRLGVSRWYAGRIRQATAPIRGTGTCWRNSLATRR